LQPVAEVKMLQKQVIPLSRSLCHNFFSFLIVKKVAVLADFI
jgi:hypothetical protein